MSRHTAQNAAQQQQAAVYQQQEDAAQQQAMVDRAAAQASAQTAAQFQAAQAAAQPAAAPGASSDDRMDKIKQLGEMKSQGLLTEEEFETEGKDPGHVTSASRSARGWRWQSRPRGPGGS